MQALRNLLLFALVSFPLIATAELEVDGIPDGSTWYFHADLDEMRRSPAGKEVYGWIEREILSDIREESGFDIGRETDRLTAFSAQPEGAVVMIEGKFSQDSRDKLLALAFAADRFETLKHEDHTYYFVEGEHHDEDVEVDAFEDGVYFSFALKDRIVATSTSEQMHALLANNGRIASGKTKSRALFVLAAEKSLLQAGVKADEMNLGDGSGWQSNILRNTEQVAVVVAEMAGKLAVDTRLVAREPELAESLASIVRGLISLQVFSDEMDPEFAQVLQTTKVDVDGSTLRISLAFDPALVVAALDR